VESHVIILAVNSILGAIGHALSAVFFKKGFLEGAGLARSFAVGNWILAGMFVPLLIWKAPVTDWTLVWQPILLGVLFLLGHLLTFVALRWGEVSLVGPILGGKVVFVAAWSWGLGVGNGSHPDWLAVSVATLAVFLLGITDVRKKGSIPLTTLLTLASANFFSLCDVLLQLWAKNFGPVAFSSTMFLVVGLLSFAFVLLRRNPNQPTPIKARKWMVAGGVATGFQAMLITLTIGFLGAATEVNILYASRGLWAMILVVTIGPMIGLKPEGSSMKYGWILRVSGACLLFLASAKVLFTNS
jgi:drug/metabolite transporter (DMT)-like permease